MWGREHPPAFRGQWRVACRLRGPRVKGMVLTALLVCAACAAPPPKDREVRLERLEADHRALITQLDDLQARLLVDAERVRFWEDMRGRHESVSAIACTSQEAHAIAMAQYLGRAPDAVRRTAASKLRQARVASVRQSAETTLPVRRP